MEITWRVQPTYSQARARPASTPDVAESIRDAIRYLPEYNSLVCTQHATALQNLDTHLRDKHGVHANARSQLVVEYQQQAWAQTVDAIVHPTSWRPPIEAIEALGAPLDGLLCVEGDCDFITVHVDAMRKQGQPVHACLGTDVFPEARPPPLLSCPSRRRPGTGAQPLRRPGGAGLVGQLGRDAKANAAAAQLVQADVAKTDWTAWFTLTGWLPHLAGRNYAHLAHQLWMPNRDEPKLKRAVWLVDQLIERSVAGLATLPRETRRWLRSAQMNNIHEQPMGRLQNPESQATYARYMAKFTIYFLRIIADEERTDKKPGPIGSSDGSGDSEEEEGVGEDAREDRVGPSGPGRSAIRHPI